MKKLKQSKKINYQDEKLDEEISYQEENSEPENQVTNMTLGEFEEAACEEENLNMNKHYMKTMKQNMKLLMSLKSLFSLKI
ncbi:MAG: hypothetical protein MZV64_27700 [Ignavibacteriales bacterium]|nr:hypothetical protein [Ignavibacteriales bacterium]